VLRCSRALKARLHALHFPVKVLAGLAGRLLLGLLEQPVLGGEAPSPPRTSTL
jgi:hypothetical protein